MRNNSSRPESLGKHLLLSLATVASLAAPSGVITGCAGGQASTRTNVHNLLHGLKNVPKQVTPENSKIPAKTRPIHKSLPTRTNSDHKYRDGEMWHPDFMKTLPKRPKGCGVIRVGARAHYRCRG